jgi:chromosome segregation ATPase
LTQQHKKILVDRDGEIKMKTTTITELKAKLDRAITALHSKTTQDSLSKDNVQDKEVEIIKLESRLATVDIEFDGYQKKIQNLTHSNQQYSMLVEDAEEKIRILKGKLEQERAKLQLFRQ